MANGSYEGKTIDDPDFRYMFTRDYLISSKWYQQRLKNKQQRDAALWQLNHAYVEKQLAETLDYEQDKKAYLQEHLDESDRMIQVVSSEAYMQQLQGTLGADWVHNNT